MTRLLFTKLLRDLQSMSDRIALMVLALSVTLTVFSAILYTWGIANREMADAYLSTNPASATVLLEPGLDAAQMAQIAAETRQRPGVLDAVPRGELMLQVRRDDGTWGANPLQVFVAAPNDPIQVERFTVEQGSWPPAPGEILIDRSSFELLDLQVGQDLVVQAPNGAAVPLRVSGMVYSPGLAPSYQEQKGHGFITSASLPVLGVPATLDALKLRLAESPGAAIASIASADRAAIVAASIDLANWLQATYGVTISEIQVPTPYAHPHQGQMNTVLSGLLIFGVAGLLLSAVLVAAMLDALFTQQIPQVGMMKAVGAHAGRVLQVYLSMVLVITLASVVLAAAPGIALGHAFASALLALVGLQAQNLAIPWWIYAMAALVGVGIPLLLALPALLRATGTTVREALDYRGVPMSGAQAGNVFTRFDLGLGRLRGIDPAGSAMALMAFGNIFRRRARLLLSVGLLASAGAVFVAGMSTQAGFQAFLDRQQELRRWDVDVRLGDGGPVPAIPAAQLAAKIPGVVRTEAWSSLQTSIIPLGREFSVTHTYPDQGHGSLSVTVIPPATTLLDQPTLREGRWLQPGETGAVVLPAGLADARAGDTIQLSINGRPTPWLVTGIAESVDHGDDIFITQAGYVAATGADRPNLLRIVTSQHDEPTRVAVADTAERALSDAGYVVRTAASVSRSTAAGAGHMLPLILAFLGLSAATSVVGFAGLASTMGANVLERTREFGVMSALGAPASTVRRLVVLEGIFIALLSCLAAAIPTVLLAWWINDYLPIPGLFRISLPAVAIWFVVVIVGAVLATLAPAARASRLTVREALAYL